MLKVHLRFFTRKMGPKWIAYSTIYTYAIPSVAVIKTIANGVHFISH